MFEDLFNFVTVFLALPVSQYFSRLICPFKTVFVHQNKWDHFLLVPTFWYLFGCAYLISVNFEVLFKSSPCMLCKALSIPRNSRISSLVFCDAPRVLTSMSSTKDESCSSGMLSISKSVS